MDKRHYAAGAAIGVFLLCSYVFELELKFSVAAAVLAAVAVFFGSYFLEPKSVTEKKIAPESVCWDDFMKSPEKKNIERSLGIFLTDAVKDKVIRVGESWYYFLNVGYGQQPILKLNAVLDRANRFDGFVGEREMYRLGEPEKLESLTKEEKLDLRKFKEIKDVVGKEDTLKELIEG